MTTTAQSDFKVNWQRPGIVGPESNPWFWNPLRGASKVPSSDFVEKLNQIDPDLRAVWSPPAERWALWVRSPKLQSPLAQGWRLLFIHRDKDGGYLPLDERFFARIHSIDSHRVGNARQYFDRIESEMKRDREKREAQFTQDTIDAAMPSWDYSQIKNIGKGNKFSEYFS